MSFLHHSFNTPNLLCKLWKTLVRTFQFVCSKRVGIDARLMHLFEMFVCAIYSSQLAKILNVDLIIM